MPVKPAPDHPPRPGTVVVLGTGGTIAGLAANAGDNVGYSAAQVGIDVLLRGVETAAGDLEAEQVAQVDSKDMSTAIWRRLAERVAHHLARPEVTGIVVTHGTDTLEETAFFLHRLFAPAKPVVLTGAMRPASSLQADGPQNLRDAIAVAADRQAAGVVVVFAGSIHGGDVVRKVHPYRLDAFSSGDSGPVARIEEGIVCALRPWPTGDALGVDALDRSGWAWPAVEILTSCAAAGGGVVRALQASGVQGIVAAGTGNGSLHHELEAALREAETAGVAVLRSTRCLDGRIVGGRGTDPLPSAGGLTPVQARIELMLRLMSAPSPVG